MLIIKLILKDHLNKNCISLFNCPSFKRNRKQIKKAWIFRTRLYFLTNPLATCYLLLNLDYLKLGFKGLPDFIRYSLLPLQTSVSRPVLQFYFQGSTSFYIMFGIRKFWFRVLNTQFLHMRPCQEDCPLSLDRRY